MKLHFQSLTFRVLLSPELFCVENAVFFICENYHDLTVQKNQFSILFYECVRDHQRLENHNYSHQN